jgi:two-component system, NtrC family, sensor kinase
MIPKDPEQILQSLAKENRILKKKLERSEADRARSEETKRNKESLLKRVIVELQDSQAILEKKSSDLEQAFNDLTLMQNKLVEAEKMSALGSLVAGVAHEINTPVGTSITLVSMLSDETETLMKSIAQGQLKRSAFNSYLEIVRESTSILLSNLNRAGELVQSFKQVAVDQLSLEQRTFRVKQYLEEVIVSLSPHLKKTSHAVTLSGDDTLTIESYPGALAQIVTNLVTNSLNHAFEPDTNGQLNFDIARQNDRAVICYTDNGCGIAPENLGKIFDPFFTTARHQGGTGLGLHIVYNLVTQKLKGSIQVQSQPDKGVLFRIVFPISVR